jgi:hypothetical protein
MPRYSWNTAKVNFKHQSINQSINQSMYIIIKRPMCHVRVHIRNNCNYIYIHITLKSLSLTTLKVVCSNLRYTGYNIILQSFSGTHRRSINLFGYTYFPPPMKQHGHNNITKIYCWEWHEYCKSCFCSQ